MFPFGPFAALFGAMGGFSAALFAATADPSGSIAPWAQVGGSITAVACLAYIATLLASGKLVALPVAEIIRDGTEREKTLIEIAKDNHEMNERLWRRWDGGRRNDRGD